MYNPLGGLSLACFQKVHPNFKVVHIAVARQARHNCHTNTATLLLQDEDYELPAPTRGGRGRRGRGTAPRNVSRAVSGALRTISRRSSSLKEVLAASGGSGEA